jgi:hypothetical protein
MAIYTNKKTFKKLTDKKVIKNGYQKRQDIAQE